MVTLTLFNLETTAQSWFGAASVLMLDNLHLLCIVGIHCVLLQYSERRQSSIRRSYTVVDVCSTYLILCYGATSHAVVEFGSFDYFGLV